jgi:hypothetical protein
MRIEMDLAPAVAVVGLLHSSHQSMTYRPAEREDQNSLQRITAAIKSQSARPSGLSIEEKD